MKQYLLHEYHVEILIRHYVDSTRKNVEHYLESKKRGLYGGLPAARWLYFAKSDGGEALYLSKKLGMPLGRRAKPTPKPQEAA